MSGSSRLAMRRRRSGRGPLLVATPSALMMVVFFFVPVAVVVYYSFLRGQFFRVSGPATVDNYDNAVTLDLHHTLAWNSFAIGVMVSTLAVALGLAIAYWLHFSAGRLAMPVLSLVIASMFAGYLVRIYAWRTVLGSNGIINSGLEWAGLIDEPLEFLIFNRLAVVVAELHLTLPLAVIILYAAIRPIRTDLMWAAEDLGARPWQRWRSVVLPLMAAPMANAWMFIFIISSSDFVTPQFLGGVDGQLIGVQVNRYFREAGDYGKGAALVVMMMVGYALVYAAIQAGLRLAKLHRVDWD